MTQNPTYNPGATPEDQWQAARAAGAVPPHPGGAAPQPAAEAPAPPPQAAVPAESGGGRPSTLVLAGAGSVLAVLAFLGGLAVGHAWDGSSTQQNQFGGPGGRQFPGQQGGTGQNGTVPGQGGFGQGQGNTGQGQGSTGQGQGGTGQQQGTVPGQGQQGQGTQPGTGTQSSGGQTQTS